MADAKKAIEAINMYPDMIDLDNLNDSTNINNVKAALNYLEDINELRRNNENFKNLSDLKTNHVIMAMAISNAAHSINGHLSHFLEVPGYYNRLYAENLAYTPNNPYNGWYYREKDAYNYLMNEYDNFNPYSNLSEEQRKEIQDLFGISSIGHYLNIVNQDATTVGMGRDTTPEKVGPYGGIYALNFSTESDAKKSVSIEEYIKRYDDFLSYIDDYESRKELEDAQSEYEKIKNELTNPSIDQYKEKINEANKSIENAEEKLDKSKASIDENIKNNKSYLKLKEEIDNLNKEIDLKTKEVEEKQKELENRPSYDPRGLEEYEKKLEESIANLNDKKDIYSKLSEENYDYLTSYLNAKVNYEDQENNLLADINHPELLEEIQRNYKKELIKLEEDYKNLVSSNKDYIESKNKLDQINGDYKKSVRKIEILTNMLEYASPNKDYINNKIKEAEQRLAYLEKLDLNYLIKNPTDKDEYLYLNKQVDELKDLINKLNSNKEKIKDINENISKLEKNLENLNNIYDTLLKSLNDLKDKINIPENKTLVKDKNKLTDTEKKSVKESIIAANKKRLKDTSIKVDSKGKATVEFADGKVEILNPEDLIKEIEYDFGEEAKTFPIESHPIEKKVGDKLSEKEITKAIKLVGLSEDTYKVRINDGQDIPTTDKLGDYIVDVSIEYKDGTKEDAQVLIIVKEAEKVDIGEEKADHKKYYFKVKFEDGTKDLVTILEDDSATDADGLFKDKFNKDYPDYGLSLDSVDGNKFNYIAKKKFVEERPSEKKYTVRYEIHDQASKVLEILQDEKWTDWQAMEKSYVIVANQLGKEYGSWNVERSDDGLVYVFIKKLEENETGEEKLEKGEKEVPSTGKDEKKESYKANRKDSKGKSSQNTNVKTGVSSLAGVLGTLAAASTRVFTSKKKKEK